MTKHTSICWCWNSFDFFTFFRTKPSEPTTIEKWDRIFNLIEIFIVTQQAKKVPLYLMHGNVWHEKIMLAQGCVNNLMRLLAKFRCSHACVSCSFFYEASIFADGIWFMEKNVSGREKNIYSWFLIKDKSNYQIFEVSNLFNRTCFSVHSLWTLLHHHN